MIEQAPSAEPGPTEPEERFFHWPVGRSPEERAEPELPPGWGVSVGFAAAYEPRPGEPAIHPGLDLNLRSGGDSDLGAPVFAAADGVVTASGDYRVWGNIVLVEHSLPDGRTLWSQYAHLGQRLAPAGKVVKRGDQIGTIGKGEADRFTAHLHFELRARDLRPAHWPGLDRAAVLRDYFDPGVVIREGLLRGLLAQEAHRDDPGDTTGRGPSSSPTPWPPPSSARIGRAPAAAGRAWAPPAGSRDPAAPASPPGRPGLGEPRGPMKPLDARALHGPRSPAPGPPVPSGKGLFVERLWELDRGDAAQIARRARGLGLRFLVLRLASGERPWLVDAEADRVAAVSRALRAAGIEAWGWGTLSGGAPDSEAGLALTFRKALSLRGWIAEPLPGYSAAARDAFLDRLRSTGPALPLVLLARGSAFSPRRPDAPSSGPAQAAASGPAVLADAADALMPRVARVGELGLAVAGAIGYGLPIVPVLDLRRAAVGGAQPTTLFLDLAQANGRRGAALLGWDACQLSGTGVDALHALARFAWQSDRAGDSAAGAPVPEPPMPTHPTRSLA